LNYYGEAVSICYADNPLNENPQEDTMTSNATNKPQDNAKTEADVKSSDGDSGKGAKSSHDEMSRQKAGKQGGAGGGAKQEQKHN
jgi:hypothetical protein